MSDSPFLLWPDPRLKAVAAPVEAAMILGCTRMQAFTKVVLPNIRGGILAAFILGFVTSFNEVPRTR